MWPTLHHSAFFEHKTTQRVMESASEEWDELLEAIPAGSREVFGELLREELRGGDELRGELGDYVDRVGEKKERYEFLDDKLAEEIAERYRELLAGWAGFGAEEQRAIQAGVLYFTEPSDADDDFGSIIGFDDDRDVLNAVVAHMGREELQIE